MKDIMLFLFHCHFECLQCWASGADSGPHSERCTTVSVGRTNIHKNQFRSQMYSNVILKEQQARVTAVCCISAQKPTRGSRGCECFHIHEGCRWVAVWCVSDDVYHGKNAMSAFSWAVVPHYLIREPVLSNLTTPFVRLHSCGSWRRAPEQPLLLPDPGRWTEPETFPWGRAAAQPKTGHPPPGSCWPTTCSSGRKAHLPRSAVGSRCWGS